MGRATLRQVTPGIYILFPSISRTNTDGATEIERRIGRELFIKWLFESLIGIWKDMFQATAKPPRYPHYGPVPASNPATLVDFCGCDSQGTPSNIWATPRGWSSRR